jgi:hypothetical protein
MTAQKPVYMPIDFIVNKKKVMSLAFKKISSKTFGPHCVLLQIYLVHVPYAEYFNTYPDSECDAVCTFFRTSNAFSIRASSVMLSAFFIFTTITLNFGFSDS